MNKCSLYLPPKIHYMPRPIRHRKMYQPPLAKGFRPIGMVGRSANEVVLLLEEYEAIKLSDYEVLTHAQAAKLMEISRPTFTRIYAKARKKIALAFIENRAIVIEGGNVNMKEDWYRCNNCNSVFSHVNAEEEVICPSCYSVHVSLINNPDYRPNRVRGKRQSYEGYCVCPECGVKIGHSRGVPCRQMKCNSCGINMVKDITNTNILSNKTLKTAISCSGEDSYSHFNAKFGRAPYFALVENDVINFVKNPAIEADNGSGPMAAEFLVNQGVKKVVSGHFGPKAEQALQAFSIEMVMYNDEDKTIEEIKNQF